MRLKKGRDLMIKRFLLILVFSLLAGLAQAAEWRFEKVDDPSGYIQGRIRYHSPYFDKDKNAFAVFTIIGRKNKKLVLSVRAQADGKPATGIATYFTNTDFKPVLELADSESGCFAKKQESSECSLSCATTAEKLRDQDYSKCNASSSQPPWVELNVELKETHWKKIATKRSNLQGLHFTGAGFYLEIDNLAKNVCQYVADANHSCRGEFNLASAKSNTPKSAAKKSSAASSSSPPSTNKWGDCEDKDKHFGGWNVRAGKDFFWVESNDLGTRLRAYSMTGGAFYARYGPDEKNSIRDPDDYGISLTIDKGKINDFPIRSSNGGGGFYKLNFDMNVEAGDRKERSVVTVKSTTKVFDSIRIYLPFELVNDTLKKGDNVVVRLSFKGRKMVVVELQADGYRHALQFARQQHKALASKFENAKCGFGPVSKVDNPASGAVMLCGLADKLPAAKPVDLRGMKLSAYPRSQKAALTQDLAEFGNPAIIRFSDISEIFKSLKWDVIDGWAFYDRDIGVQAHPAGGPAITIGRIYGLNLFRKLAKSLGSEFRCAKLTDVKTCVHPKNKHMSKRCN